MGTLIALEGIDGSGKSTQARGLRDALQASGRSAVLFREPGDSEYGDRIRELFKLGRNVSAAEEMRLFLEDRRIDVRDNIEPALADGAVVIMDRYYLSSMAYQGALGIDPEAIRSANEAFAPRPDLTLILDLPPQSSGSRIRARRDVPNSFERADYLARVREIFNTFVNGDVVRIDASREEDEVARCIWETVSALLDPGHD